MPNPSRAITRLTKYFERDVEYLPDNHYVANGAECDICGEADGADSAETMEGISTVSATTVVRTKKCSHTFHGLCLATWLQSRLLERQEATCPKCRSRLIYSGDVERVQLAAHELLESVAALRLQVAAWERHLRDVDDAFKTIHRGLR